MSHREQVEAVFLALVECAASDRAKRLDALRQDAPTMFREVSELLAFHDRAGGFLEDGERLASSLGLMGPPEGGDHELPQGSSIGGYTILRRVGVGGMGVVYAAQQERPRRIVALKVIRRELASVSLVRRFEHEAEVLGRLQHPGIAHIFEAGTADAGFGEQPYIAMELVEGIPLMAYAEQRELSTRERLLLFLKVCEAVHHAHQRGIIHRDLKPANILVVPDPLGSLTGDSPADTRPARVGQPKILDFGIARASDADLHVTTVLTTVGQLIGTLPYMSPEQVASDPNEIDTRADVYALGILLYELLTGRLPHDLRSCPIPEAIRVIREEEPPRLSSISRVFRGDVDTIVRKAMEKEKERRYGSAAELAADIRRYLNGEPIDAKRDSALYVLRKSLRRYRTAATAAAVVICAMGTLGVVSFFQARENRRLAGSLALELHTSDIERGRLFGLVGNASGEEVLWREYLREPDSLDARWALWEYYSRRPCLFTAVGHTEAINGIVFSPDDQVIATGSGDGTIRLWNARDGRAVRSLPGHAAAVTAVAFSPSGKLLASTARDGSVRLSEVEGLASPALAGHEGTAQAAAFSADGRWLATVDLEGTLKLWNGATGDLALTQSTGQELLTSVCFRGDGRRLATGAHKAIKIWTVETEADLRPRLTELHQLNGHTDNIASLIYSHDDRLLASGSRDRTIRLWNSETGESKGVIKAFNGTIQGLVFTPDDARLIDSGFWSIEFWDARTLQRTNWFATRTGNWSLDVSHDGRMIVAGEGGHDPALHVWEISPGRCLTAHRVHAGGARIAGASRCGRLVATGGCDGVIRLWDPRTNQMLEELQGHKADVRATVFAPDGKWLATGSIDNEIRIWDTESRQLLTTMSGFAANSSPMAVSPDGKILASGEPGGAWILWEVPAGRELMRMEVASVEPLSAAFSVDGRLLATVTREPTVRIWDVQSGAHVREVKHGTDGAPWCAAFSPDGRFFAVGNWNKTIGIWDARSWEFHGDLLGHTQLVSSLSFEPGLGEPLLASTSYDGTIKLWNVEELRCLCTLEANAWEAYSVDFLPDGKSLVSAHADGTIGFWDLTYYDSHIVGNASYQLRKLSMEQNAGFDLDRARRAVAKLQTRRIAPEP